MRNAVARRGALGIAAALLGTAIPRHGEAHCEADDERKGWWPSLARYTKDNEALIQSGAKVDCVFMGDSITELWLKRRPEFFGPGMICRGITGQTTPQMLVRFRADVVSLKPKLVHIMAGTNDIAGNTGVSSPRMIADTIATMTEIALANGIRVVLASIPPAARYPWKPRVDPVRRTLLVNLLLQEYASHTGARYADYYSVLDDGHGGMRSGWATGDVHPTARGYMAMEPVALAAIQAARSQKPQTLCHA